MESVYTNPMVENIDSTGKVWAALADDTGATVKNLTNVVTALDRIAKNTQTSFEEITKGLTANLSEIQRKVINQTLSLAQNSTSDFAKKFLNDLSTSIKGVVDKAEVTRKSTTGATVEMTNVAVQRALRSTVVPALQKELQNLTSAEFGRLAEALGDQSRSNKTNTQNRVAVGYRSLANQIAKNKNYQNLINSDKAAQEMFNAAKKALNIMRADEIMQGRGSSTVNQAFVSFLEYAKKKGVQFKSSSPNSLGGSWGRQADKAVSSNLTSMAQSVSVDRFLKTAFKDNQQMMRGTDSKRIQEQLKATTDKLKQQGIPYELRRNGKEVQVVVFDPNTYRYSGGKVDEKQAANLTFAVGGYNKRATHLIPYQGQLLPANVVQARLNAELLTNQKISSIASMKRKVSDINEMTAYKAVNKYEHPVDNPKTAKDRALREGTVRYDVFQNSLFELEKSLRPDVYTRDIQEGIENLISVAIGHSIKEITQDLKAVQDKYNLSDTIMAKFKQEGEWLKDVTWMSEEDRGHSRAYLKSAVSNKMYLPTRKIQNRDIMSYADGVEDKIVQTVQIDLDRMASHIQKSGLDKKTEARYLSLIEGMGKDVLVMAEDQIEKLNSIRENASVKISKNEMKALERRYGKGNTAAIFAHLLGKEGRSAQSNQTLGLSQKDGQYILTGNELVRADVGTKINSEGFNLRHVIQRADQDFIDFVLGAAGIERDKNARALTISKLNTEASGRNLGPFVTGIINEALYYFKDKTNEEVETALKGSGIKQSDKVIEAAAEILKTPFGLERIIGQATGGKASNQEQGRFLSQVLYTIAQASGHKGFKIDKNGQLSTDKLGVSFMDKVGIRESEYAARGDTSLPTNYEFDDFYRAASRAGFDFKHLTPEQLKRWSMMSVGATAKEIDQRNEEFSRYKEHLSRQQQMLSSYDPNYLEKNLGDEDLIVIGDKKLYENKIGNSHLIDIKGLQSSHRAEDGTIDNREATIWGKLEELLSGKDAKELGKTRIVVDLGEDMGNLRFMDLAANIGEYGSYNTKLEDLLMGVSADYSAADKSSLLSDTYKSEMYNFENTGGALNARFLAQAQENLEKRRRDIEREYNKSAKTEEDRKRLLGQSFYGENLNVTKLQSDNEVAAIADAVEHQGAYVSTERMRAWAAGQLSSGIKDFDKVDWGKNLLNFLQQLGAIGTDSNKWTAATKGVTTFKEAVDYVTDALTVGTQLHSTLYGSGDLTKGANFTLARNPFSQMVNAQFGDYLFAKQGLGNNVVESNRGLNTLVMGDFDGDKLLVLLTDLEKTAEEDLKARQEAGLDTNEAEAQLTELKAALEQTEKFNDFNYRVMSANLKTVASSDVNTSVLYDGSKAGLTTEEQRNIILRYQNRSKGQTGFLSNLAKGGRNLLEESGYGFAGLLGKNKDDLLKYGQGAVIFQVLETLEQDAISAKKLWDDALEQIKAVEGKTETDLQKMTSSERTKLVEKYLDDQMSKIVDQAYNGKMSMVDLFGQTKKLGMFENGLDQRRSLEILNPIANKDNAAEMLESLFGKGSKDLANIAEKAGYKNWSEADKDIAFAGKLRQSLQDGKFEGWTISAKALERIIGEFDTKNVDFLAKSKLYSGRFQEQFGISSLLADNNLSVAAAVLKKVESLRAGLSDGKSGGSGGAGGPGDGTKDIVTILTEIRDLLAKQGRGDLNQKFGQTYLSPTQIARTIIPSNFKESNMDMMRDVLKQNLKNSNTFNNALKWSDEERATAFGFFGNTAEFEKQREYMLGSLRGTLTHAIQEKGAGKVKTEQAELKKQMQLLGFDDERIGLEQKEAERAAKLNLEAEQAVFGKEGKLGSEIGFKFDAGNGKRIGGKIDALYLGKDGRVYVGDYKTGKTVGPEEAAQVQMYQEIIRQILNDLSGAFYGNKNRESTLQEIQKKYGLSDQELLGKIWDSQAFKVGNQSYLWHYNEGSTRAITVDRPADDILAKMFNNEFFSPEEIEYEKKMLTQQTGRTYSDKAGFLRDYKDYYNEAYGTKAFIEASKGVVEKDAEREALEAKLNEVGKNYGTNSPLYQKLSDYYQNLLSEIDILGQMREKVAKEYNWDEADRNRGLAKVKEGVKVPKEEKYGYNKILKEDASERQKNYNAIGVLNKQIAAAEKKMLEYDKQSRTTVGKVGSYQSSTDTLIAQQKEELRLLIEKRKEQMANSNLTQAETASLDQQLATMRLVNKEEVKRKNKGANNWLDMITSGVKNTITRMFDFSSVYRVINKLSQSLQKVLDLTNQLDQATFNIQVVTGQSRDEVSGLITDYRQLADQLGATTVQIASAANEWLRQGYEASQAAELITASTYLSKLGMIEAGQATEYLTSMIKGFKLEVTDAVDVVSKLTSVDMVAATSAGDIAAALQNVSTTAQLAGVSLDETIAYASTIIETTQRDASSVGMALRTMMSRYGNVKAGAYTRMNLENSSDVDTENLNDIEKVLGKIGISIRSTNTEFRSFSEVLDELGDKWINLDSVSKNAIATAMAGVRQREQFLVLMENLDRAEELEEVSKDSQGTAETKYASYMETIESAKNRLSNAWSEMAQRLEESGVVKAFTDLAVLLTKALIPALNAVVSTLIAYNGYKIPTAIGNMNKTIASHFPSAARGSFRERSSAIAENMLDWRNKNALVKDPVTGEYRTKKTGFLSNYVDEQLGGEFTATKNNLNEFSNALSQATDVTQKFAGQERERMSEQEKAGSEPASEEKTAEKDKETSEQEFVYKKKQIAQLEERKKAAEERYEEAVKKEKKLQFKVNDLQEQANLEIENKKQLLKKAGDEVVEKQTVFDKATTEKNSAWSKYMQASRAAKKDGATKEEIDLLKSQQEAAKKNLEEAKSAQAKAQTDLEAAQQTQQSAQAEFEKTQAIRANTQAINADSQATTSSVQAEMTDAQASLQNAQAELADAQSTRQSAQAELQDAQASLSQGQSNRSGVMSSQASAWAGVGISALTSGITTGMSTEGSTTAKAVSGTVSGGATLAGGALGMVLGGPLGAAIGSGLGSTLGSIVAPLFAELIDKEENDRKQRIEDATKLLDTLKAQESNLEEVVSISKQNNLLSDDIKSIRENVQAIKDADEDTGALKDAFAAIIGQDEYFDLITATGSKSAADLYLNLDSILADETISSEIRSRLAKVVKMAHIDAEDAAFMASKEGSSLTAEEEKERLERKLEKAYLKSGISDEGSLSLARRGITDVESQIAGLADVELTTEVKRLIQLLMKQDDSTSVQSLLAGSNFTLSDIVNNTYGLGTEVQTDLLNQAALALGMTIDEVQTRVDDFGLLTIGNLNSSIDDLSESLESLTSYFDELISTGTLSVKSLREIIAANGAEATAIGQDNLSLVADAMEQTYRELGGQLLEDWTSGSASGAQIYKKLLNDPTMATALEQLDKGGFNLEDTSMDALFNALMTPGFGELDKTTQDKIWELYLDTYKQAAKSISEVTTAEYNKVVQSAQEAIDRSLERQQNALEEQKSALEDINSQREYENKLIEAKIKLENAQNEKKKVWREGVGWVYEADTSAIADAQKELDELDNEKKINELQVMIDELQAQRDWMDNLTESKEFEKAQEFLKEWAENADSTMEVLKYWENVVENPPTFDVLEDNAELKKQQVDATNYQNAQTVESLKQAYVDLASTEGGRILLGGGSLADLGKMSVENINDFNEKRAKFETAYSNAEGYLDNDAIRQLTGLSGDKGESTIEGYKTMFGKTNKSDGGFGNITSGVGSTQINEEQRANKEEKYIVTDTPASAEGENRWNKKWRDYLEMYSPSKKKFIKVVNTKEKPKSTAEILSTSSFYGRFFRNRLTNGIYYLGHDGVMYVADKEITYNDGTVYRSANGGTFTKPDGTVHSQYATGTLSAPGGLSMVNDDPQYGLEGIITPNGTLTALPSKSGVVPADMTRNVWQLGEVAPNLVKSLVDIQGKFNSPNGFGTDESFNVDHLDIHMVAQPGFSMDDFVRELKAARDLTRHS